MEYIGLRHVGREGLKEIHRQVVRLKKLGKAGKEIEELTGARQNRTSEIWTAYQREGKASLERKKYGRKAGIHMILTAEGKIVEENIPEDFGITGKRLGIHTPVPMAVLSIKMGMVSVLSA